MSTLSSQLDLFFSGFVNNIASSFVVYSDIGPLNLSENESKNKFDELKLELQNDNKEEKEWLYPGRKNNINNQAVKPHPVPNSFFFFFFCPLLLSF